MVRRQVKVSMAYVAVSRSYKLVKLVKSLNVVRCADWAEENEYVVCEGRG